MSEEFRVIIREALREADGMWKEAAELVRGKLSSDPALFHQLMTPLVDQAIWDAIRYEAHTQRIHMVEAQMGQSEGLHKMAKRRARQLLDFPLQGGVPLRKATKVQVQRDAEFYAKIARTNGVYSTWLKSVARRLHRPEQVVEQRLTEKDVAGLLEKAVEKLGGKT